jgi:predicted DsbA family dithiol-disulfide isomerase
MAETKQGRLRIDVWSDVVCPFCWIGKHRLEGAIRRMGLEGEVDVVFHAFELNPAAPPARPLMEYLAGRFGGEANVRAVTQRTQAMGASEGLAFDWARAIAVRTFDAHRVALFAQSRGRGAETMERLMRAHFSEGRDLSDHATLAALAAEAGLDRSDVERALAGDGFAAQVRTDEAEARGFGIGGVPFFVLGGRYAVSGAQPPEVFEEALRTARQPSSPQV